MADNDLTSRDAGLHNGLMLLFSALDTRLPKLYPPDSPIKYVLPIKELMNQNAIAGPESSTERITEVLEFDGRGRMRVPFCCEGKVIVRIVSEADAYRCAITGPVVKSQSYHCKKCDRWLNPTPAPAPPKEKKQRAFTLIELLIFLSISVLIGSIFLWWRNGCQAEGVAAGTLVQAQVSNGGWVAELRPEGSTTSSWRLTTVNTNLGAKLISLVGRRVLVRYVKKWGAFDVLKLDESVAATAKPETP